MSIKRNSVARYSVYEAAKAPSPVKLIKIFRDFIQAHMLLNKAGVIPQTATPSCLFFVKDRSAIYDVLGVVVNPHLDPAADEDTESFKSLLFMEEMIITISGVPWTHIDSLESIFWNLVQIVRGTTIAIGQLGPTNQHSFVAFEGMDGYLTAADKLSILNYPHLVSLADKWNRPAIKNLLMKMTDFFLSMFIWRIEHYEKHGATSEPPGLREEAQEDFSALKKMMDEAMEEIEDEDLRKVLAPFNVQHGTIAQNPVVG